MGMPDVTALLALLEASNLDERQRRIERQKLDALLGYCETASCRRQVLLGYFGEREPCGLRQLRQLPQARARLGRARRGAEGALRRRAHRPALRRRLSHRRAARPRQRAHGEIRARHGSRRSASAPNSASANGIRCSASSWRKAISRSMSRAMAGCASATAPPVCCAATCRSRSATRRSERARQAAARRRRAARRRTRRRGAVAASARAPARARARAGRAALRHLPRRDLARDGAPPAARSRRHVRDPRRRRQQAQALRRAVSGRARRGVRRAMPASGTDAGTCRGGSRWASTG